MRVSVCRNPTDLARFSLEIDTTPGSDALTRDEDDGGGGCGSPSIERDWISAGSGGWDDNKSKSWVAVIEVVVP